MRVHDNVNDSEVMADVAKFCGGVVGPVQKMIIVWTTILHYIQK